MAIDLMNLRKYKQQTQLHRMVHKQHTLNQGCTCHFSQKKNSAIVTRLLRKAKQNKNKQQKRKQQQPKCVSNTLYPSTYNRGLVLQRPQYQCKTREPLSHLHMVFTKGLLEDPSPVCTHEAPALQKRQGDVYPAALHLVQIVLQEELDKYLRIQLLKYPPCAVNLLDGRLAGRFILLIPHYGGPDRLISFHLEPVSSFTPLSCLPCTWKCSNLEECWFRSSFYDALLAFSLPFVSSGTLFGFMSAAAVLKLLYSIQTA
ncbi:hypothetical protein Anapl_15678 [Anas platyrhynchos]|uniref:Uncharacterized protein n=1 Tax=Anas platyrhynchos TaxID=8839 RepID=R0LEW5_ANAPL|nr:hypothetical protein Anapl_15678 [Anas platyrhynchos]